MVTAIDIHSGRAGLFLGRGTVKNDSGLFVCDAVKYGEAVAQGAWMLLAALVLAASLLSAAKALIATPPAHMQAMARTTDWKDPNLANFI